MQRRQSCTRQCQPCSDFLSQSMCTVCSCTPSQCNTKEQRSNFKDWIMDMYEDRTLLSFLPTTSKKCICFDLRYWTVLDNFAICMLALLGHILHSTFLFDLFQTLLKSLTFSHPCTRADNRPKWWSGFLWVLVNMSRVRLFKVKCQLDDSVDFGRDLMLRTIQNNGGQVVVGELQTSASFFNQLS